MTGGSAWLFIAAAYGVGALLLAFEVGALVLRSRKLRRQQEGRPGHEA